MNMTSYSIERSFLSPLKYVAFCFYRPCSCLLYIRFVFIATASLRFQQHPFIDIDCSGLCFDRASACLNTRGRMGSQPLQVARFPVAILVKIVHHTLSDDEPDFNGWFNIRRVNRFFCAVSERYFVRHYLQGSTISFVFSNPQGSPDIECFRYDGMIAGDPPFCTYQFRPTSPGHSALYYQASIHGKNSNRRYELGTRAVLVRASGAPQRSTINQC